MGKTKGGTNKVSKTSSGKRRVTKAKAALRRITMKIARWERYKEEGKPSWTADKEKKKKSRPTTVSRYNNWDTTGLKKHAALLEEIIAKGRKVKVA